jgi:hypothetical protein
VAGVNPVRLGLSAAALAVVVLGVRFVATDQQAEIRRQAFDMQEKSVAKARAEEKGVTLWELREQASAACMYLNESTLNKSTASPPTGGGIFSVLPMPDRGVTYLECFQNYIYGDEMSEPTKELVELWLLALGIMIMKAGAIGAATTALFKSGPFALRFWMGWLRGS